MAFRVTLGEIKKLALIAKDSIWEQARSQDRDVKIYLHWSAGRYDSIFSDYHINITGNGVIYATTNDFSEVLAHTWRRNTGSFGLSLCCAYQATSQDIGPYAPTETQIDFMGQVGSILADAWDLTIDKQRILTHGEAADNEDGLWLHEQYGPKTTCERWDLEYLGTSESPKFDPYDDTGKRGGDVLRGKMQFYREKGLYRMV